MTAKRPALIDRVIYETPLLKIGAFRCEPGHPDFEHTGRIENYCFVFPRTAVVIEHDHVRPFVANPNVVTFYNRGDDYRRSAIAPDGDRSDWFSVRPDVVAEMLQDLSQPIARRADELFPFTHALSQPYVYACQRQLFATVSLRRDVESLWIEEATMWLLDRLLRSALERGPSGVTAVVQRHVDLVQDAQALLSTEDGQTLTLTALAESLNVSIFHLCRVFRRVTGCTLHAYRSQLRLRRSLEALQTNPPGTIVRCAMDSGFSSHSHYGETFKKAFQQTPSEFIEAVNSPSNESVKHISRTISAIGFA